MEVSIYIYEYSVYKLFVHAVPMKATRGHQIPQTRTATYTRWDSNPGPLEMQPVL